MFIKLRPLLFSIIYFIGLELIVFSPGYLTWVLFFLVTGALYEGRKVGRVWKFSILPVFFTLFSVALLQLISVPYEEQVFIALSAIMHYLCLLGIYRLTEYRGDQTARGMLTAATSSAIFFAFTGSYGLYLNFLVPLYFLMLVYALTTLLISYQYFSIIENNKQRVWTYSFLLSLVMVELVWVMNFWPFGYLTTGVIALILYYVLWDLTQSYFLNLLSRRRVVANMLFFSAMVALVLLSSKWIPVI
jgi:hypothetical protein